MPARKGNVTKSLTADTHPRSLIVKVEDHLVVAFKGICEQAGRDMSDLMREAIIRSVKAGNLDVFKEIV